MSLVWTLDECTPHQSRLHLRGWCFDDRSPITKVEAVFLEPRAVVPLRSFGQPSPDVAASVSAKAGNNRFDEWIEVPPDSRGRTFRLQCTLGDGTIVLGSTDIDRGELPPAPAPGAGEELAAVKRREAEFRAQMVQEFLDRGERNTYLHALRQEKAALQARAQQAAADAELLVRRLEAAEDRSAALERELARLRGSISWRLLAPVRAAFDAVFGAPPAWGAPPPAVAAGSFTYFLHTSPFRVYREESFTLRGWAWPEDGRGVTGVRVRLDDQLAVGKHGLEEPEVAARHPNLPAGCRPGFEVTFPTPPGRHLLSLEAQLDGAAWQSILRTSIWGERSP
jgi:hypothetical protein